MFNIWPYRVLLIASWSSGELLWYAGRMPWTNFHARTPC